MLDSYHDEEGPPSIVLEGGTCNLRELLVETQLKVSAAPTPTFAPTLSHALALALALALAPAGRRAQVCRRAALPCARLRPL